MIRRLRARWHRWLHHTREFEKGYIEGWDANHCNYPNELLETAWGIIANGGEGDWSRESADWQKAAAKFRSDYFAYLAQKKS